MKIYFFAYRNWALNIIKKISSLENNFKIEIFTKQKNEFTKRDIKIFKIKYITKKNNLSFYKKCLKNKPDAIFFIGWSSIIRDILYKNFLCLCLHPSKLPEFRGGSPIQNQIIRNKLKSGLTLFKMNKFIDGGPISLQCELSLKGNISIIFKRIEKKGIYLIKNFLYKLKNNKTSFKKQNLFNKKIYKRRLQYDSFFSISNVRVKSFNYLNNFINMLTDPYPNAYTILGNKKIFIQKIKKTKQNKNFLINANINKIKNANNYLIKLNNCNVKILNSKIY